MSVVEVAHGVQQAAGQQPAGGDQRGPAPVPDRDAGHEGDVRTGNDDQHRAGDHEREDVSTYGDRLTP